MILEDETYEAFEYYSRDLLPHSCKPILAACDECRKIRKTSKNQYHALCKSCANKGKTLTEEHKAKISAAKKGETHTEEHKAHISAAMKGNQNALGCISSEETKALQSAAAIRRMHNSPQAMTAPEKRFEKICIEYDLPFTCNTIAAKSIGDAIPDFIHKTRKVVVEVFGNYYHGQWLGFKHLKYIQTVEGRQKQLKAEGYKLIVFWESDLMREDADKFVLRELKKERI